jgi:hypothetical protein
MARYQGARYEYKVMGFEDTDGLNEIGRNGWKMVKFFGTYVSELGGNTGLFIRQLTGYELA